MLCFTLIPLQLDSGKENQDFYGDSQLASFNPALSDDTTSVTLTVAADGIPEINETYYFTLKLLNSSSTDARVGFPNACTVKILANDDAYGLFSFIYVSFFSFSFFCRKKIILCFCKKS